MNRKPLAVFITVCAIGLPLFALLDRPGPTGQPLELDTSLVSRAEASEHTPSSSSSAALVPGPAVAEPVSTAVQGPAVATPADSETAVSAGPAVAAPSDARGVVRAVREATLSAGMTGEIVKLPVTEGQAFKKGDLLVAFNCDRPNAELRAAEAAVQVEQKTVETNEELEKFNSIGKFDLLISVAKLNKAKAEYDALQAQIKQCKVVAPFSGRVIERMTREYESASSGEPMLRIVDTGALELDLIIPSKWLQWLKPGSPFSFTVDETGQAFEGTVDRVLPSVDPVSKTMKIIGRFGSKSTGKTIPGMSGTATFTSAG